MSLRWTLTPFQELTVDQLYTIIQLRISVFVVEQQCNFQDADDKDRHAWHLCCWDGDNLAAYTRILPPGISYKEASIGRVLTAKNVRGKKIGTELMQRSIEEVYRLFGKTAIQIGAQLYLQKFYETFGFKKNSDVYLEDNIPHIKMILL
ncbi:MAG: GNAT family N-acetyltransferase [Bacteroidetes bacterium]|nr:GNAT family N-acetyltransferase [Bacteroidota bacterium]